MNIPLLYLEGYQEGVRKAHKQYGHYPRLIVTQGLQECDYKKLWVAEAQNAGAKIVYIQHGGGYGLVRYDYTEIHETEIADLYLSWIKSDREKVIQVPSQKYILKNNSKGHFTLINVTYPSFYKFHSGPIGEQFMRNIEDQIIFLSAVSEGVKKRIHIKQYPDQHDWPVSSIYRDAKFDYLIDDESSYADLLKNSELLIISYLGTAWQEALMNNIPMVVFSDPKSWAFRENVSPYLDELRNVKILHDTPESAASHINSIESDISTWWNEDDLQKVRSRFCEEFSYTENEWPAKWAEAIQAHQI